MNADHTEVANESMQSTCKATDHLIAMLGQDLSPEILSLVSGGDGVPCW